MAKRKEIIKIEIFAEIKILGSLIYILTILIY